VQLVGMLDSPFVRRVAVAMLTAGTPFRHRSISLFRQVDAFGALSPLLKAPSLALDDGTVIVDSSVILEYLATLSPALRAMTAGASSNPALAAQVTGVALTVCEKAVQVYYEHNLRGPGERSESWLARALGQLGIGLAQLDRAAPREGWLTGELAIADISAVCAFGFVRAALAQVVDLAPYPALAAYAARAEALPAFRAAPHRDGFEIASV